jgi:hypothetical protein
MPINTVEALVAERRDAKVELMPAIAWPIGCTCIDRPCFG